MYRPLVIAAVLATSTLAACGGPQPPIGAPDLAMSWMLPEAKTDDLLYVSYGREVDVFDYKSLQ